MMRPDAKVKKCTSTQTSRFPKIHRRPRFPSGVGYQSRRVRPVHLVFLNRPRNRMKTGALRESNWPGRSFWSVGEVSWRFNSKKGSQNYW